MELVEETSGRRQWLKIRQSYWNPSKLQKPLLVYEASILLFAVLQVSRSKTDSRHFKFSTHQKSLKIHLELQTSPGIHPLSSHLNLFKQPPDNTILGASTSQLSTSYPN
jgi:hypothetical protein